jgi:hypothetical protein
MFSGIALAYGDLPVGLIERHELHERLHERGGEREVRFLLWERERVLPVWLHGRLLIVRWGVRRGESKALPCTAWTWRATVEAGGWAAFGAEPVVIPATRGLDLGVWFAIKKGMHAVANRDEQGRAVVFPVCEPASHHYEVMTRSEWMPVLLDDRI